MDQSNEKNTIQKLTDICGEFQQIANSLRVPSSEPLVNDIPDIYDNAASLLTTIITCKAGFDPNTNILKQASEYESDLISAEKSFMKRMEESMNRLASKVEDSQDQYKKLCILVDTSLKEITQTYEKTLSTVEKKNENKLLKIERELNKKSAAHAAEELKLKENFKRELSEHLKKVDDEWNQKIKEAETEVVCLLKDLHIAIHTKQENNLSKTEEIRNLEKLNAAELENEKSALNEIKNVQLKILEELNSKLEELNREADEENEKAKKISEDLELKMSEEKKLIIEANDKELETYENKKKEASKKLKDMENEFEQRKASAHLKMKEAEQSYEGKLLQEKDLTQKKIDEINDKLNHEYIPILNILNQRIIKAEQQRGISLEQLHKSSLESSESNEAEIIEMNKRHQEERTKLRAEIRKEKQKLQDLLNQREVDVEKLRRDLEKQVKDVEAEFENREKKHIKQISEMMDDFAQLQREYDEDTKRRKEERDKKRIEEVERLKIEHQKRLNDIIYEMEQKTIIDCENAYNEGIKEAQLIHQQDINNIKMRINEYNQAMEEMRDSMALLKIKHEERLKNIEADKLKESEDRIGYLKSDFEQEKNFFIQQKKALLFQLKQIKKKKEAVDQQFEIEKKQLDELALTGPILSPLDVLRQSFNNVIAEMKHQETDLIVEKRNLEKHIGELQISLDEIGQKVEEKQKEMDEFLKGKQEKLTSYFTSIRNQLELTFEKVKKRPIEFESSRAVLRKEIDDKIAELQTDLLKKRKEAELESSELINDKEKKLILLEKELQIEFENRIEKLKEQHQIEMMKMNQELEDLRKSHEVKMIEIQKKYDAEKIEADKFFKKQKADLQEKTMSLFQEEKKLQDKIEDTPIPQCTDCNNRRETINRLTSRRNELLDRMAELSNISIQNDQKVQSMFPQRIGASNSKSALSVTHSPRVQVLRTKSALKKTIVTPH